VTKKFPESSHQSKNQTKYSGVQELLDSELGLPGYNRELVNLLAKELDLAKGMAEGKVKLVEFGAGTGTLAELWRDTFLIDPICIEIDSILVQIIKSKGFETYNRLDEMKSKIKYLYTSNVLEHIEDDVNTLRQIRGKMEENGIIAIYVPALPILFSDLDRSVGHFRRYTKKELLYKVRLAGFEVRACYYNDCIGVIASLLVKVFGYKKQTRFGSKESLLLYDRYVYPISRIFDRFLFKFVIGKNILLVAATTDSDVNKQLTPSSRNELFRNYF
jgi:hypothetical protein